MRRRASVFRRSENKYPIMCCRSGKCELNTSSERQKIEGRKYAAEHPHHVGIIGQGKTSSRPIYKRSRAEHLAGVAHHNSDVRRRDADGLLRWFMKKAKDSTKEEQVKFLEHFRDFSTPSMKMDDVFREAARLFRTGEIETILKDSYLDMIVDDRTKRRALIVASVSRVMSLYRGASAKFSFSSRMFAKYFKDEELQISHTTVNAAIKDLMMAGLIKLQNAHDIIMRGGQMIFRAATFKWLGKRPFDDVADKLLELKNSIRPNFKGLVSTSSSTSASKENSQAVETASVTLQSAVELPEPDAANVATSVNPDHIWNCIISVESQQIEEENEEKNSTKNNTLRDRHGGEYWELGY